MYRARSLRFSQLVYRYQFKDTISVNSVKIRNCHLLSRTFEQVKNKHLPRVPVNGIACRYKSNGENGIYVQYEDLLQLIEEGDVMLIDVRDAKEIQESGEFPGAYNIPLQDLKKALQMKDEEFKELYGFNKPKPTDTNVVFASLKSVKSSAALEIAHKLGLTKTRQYVNGYEEWVEKQRSKAAG